MTARRPSSARRVAAGVLVVLLTGVAGCSTGGSEGADPSRSPSATQSQLPSGDATDGVPLDGTGYSLTVPPGWAETTDAVQGRFEQVDASAGDTGVTGGFADNVNVIVSDKRRIRTRRKAERILKRELALVGQDVRIQEPGELDGEAAYHATARLRVGRIKVRTSQYFARHGKAWYLVTFSYGPQTDAETEAEEVQSMLDSWSWED